MLLPPLKRESSSIALLVITGTGVTLGVAIGDPTAELHADRQAATTCCVVVKSKDGFTTTGFMGFGASSFDDSSGFEMNVVRPGLMGITSVKSVRTTVAAAFAAC